MLLNVAIMCWYIGYVHGDRQFKLLFDVLEIIIIIKYTLKL